METEGEPRFLEQVYAHYDSAGKKSGVSEDYLKFIRACDNIFRFEIPLRRDNGSIE